MIDLVEHILYHAPKTVRGAERILLIAIAEQTRVKGEPRDIPVADLAQALGEPDRQVREVAARLTEKLRKATGDEKITVRVPLGQDRNGNPLYTKQGLVPRWILPSIPVPSGCTCPVCRRGTSQVRAGAANTAPAGPPHKDSQLNAGAVFAAPPKVGAVFSSPGAANTAHGAVKTAPTPCRSRKTHTQRADDDGKPAALARGSVCDEPKINTAAGAGPSKPMPADDPRWLELRTAYPKQDGRAAARRVFTDLLAEGVDPGLILRRLKTFVARKEREGKEHRYWPNLTTWLDNRGWEDEEDTIPNTPERPAKVPRDQECRRHYRQPATGCRLCAVEAAADADEEANARRSAA